MEKLTQNMNPKDSETEFFLLLKPTNDPLFQWASSNQQLWRIWVIAFIAILVGFLPIIPAISENVLYNNTLRPDLVHDLGYWGMMVIAPPLVIIAIGSYLQQLPNSVIEIIESKVVEIDDSGREQFFIKYNRIVRSKWPVVISFVLSLSAIPLTIYLFIDRLSGNWHWIPGQDEVSYSFIVSLVPVCLAYYLFSTAILHVVKVSRIVRLLFNHKVNVFPLHPDRCGGLYPLGHMCVKMNIAVFAIGLVTINGIINNVNVMGIPLLSPHTFIVISAYISATIAIFFLPLLPAHNAMSNAKSRSLRTVHKYFLSLHLKLHDKILRNEHVDKESVEELERLRKIYELADSMPVYPFNAQIVRSFAISIVIPIAIGVLTQYTLDFFGWVAHKLPNAM